MFKVGIIIASDKGFSGEREDLSGKAIIEILESKGYQVKKAIILPDDEELLLKEIIYMADEQKVDLI
ncbi:MAG TPA: molybdopterin-binding protein, partial [Clostridia bacterium]|nr:molybdopterin-binding protein [Clostridia bacterium]